MRNSEILVLTPPLQTELDAVAIKLREAYIKERQQLELTEIELNRARIVMIDENGKMIRLPLLTEH
ncbi:hypothetical protein ACPF3V_002836 [Vibrio cholerae]|uniref:hypothetical protein n=1 Tax=Vibrio cholerae TaxID=666 RepID=UPI000C7F3101|nr:hypothetical protein [Vibrio cholerae]EGR2534023.1 hypothetical protein [Vibrio cholerae]PKQ51945.1 hypothetical protein CR151_18075 [Vibrio cholerae]TXZ09845.1 hypothetical protein FXE57_17010 [Vibrio cholerae]TYA62328.1 hypothetical protein FXE28_15450 [Vibrio cholerae]BCK15823.1 hypothetical protein VCSRO45_3444 [Vibrio cholerae]